MDLNHSAILASNHFLSLPRPDTAGGPPSGVVDTTTLAAHDFDVDPRTGFLPPQVPMSRLPQQWESWERALDDAVSQGLKLGDAPTVGQADRAKSESWRNSVRNVCTPVPRVSVVIYHSSAARHSSYYGLEKIRNCITSSPSCFGLDHAFLHPFPPPGCTRNYTLASHTPPSSSQCSAPAPSSPHILRHWTVQLGPRNAVSRRRALP